MSKKIIIAGGGHGGIPCGVFLAKAGFDVTVYEKSSEGKLGYDWTDIFDPKAVSAAGCTMPNKSKYEYKTDMTFFGPSENTSIRQRVPEDELEIKMERHDIYDMLVSRALDCGVKFVYDCEIISPLMQGDRVIGIKTSKGDFYGDMVIDSCGCESPVRSNLPDCCGIQKHPVRFEKFYVYRGFYNKASEDEVKDKYKVCLLPEGKLGIGWVATEEKYTDLLIGRFDPFDMEEVERTAEYFRSKNPSLGTKLVRGGQFVQIPVRQPLSVLVADGYAAIGDSAFMTVPIIGSGIGNSMKMSKVLADAIIADKTETYSAETLWPYQVNYYKMLGNGLAPLAAVKLLLTRISPQQLDFAIDNGLLTWREMTITANSTSIWKFLHFDPKLPQRGKTLLKDSDLTKKGIRVVRDVAEVVALTAIMPKDYSRKAVLSWAKKYDRVFTRK